MQANSAQHFALGKCCTTLNKFMMQAEPREMLYHPQ